MKLVLIVLFFVKHAGAVITGVSEIDDVLLKKSSVDKFNNEVLKYKTPQNAWVPSTMYFWQDFAKAVELMYKHGVGETKLWLGDPGSDDRVLQAKVHLAAFIAQSMKETIQYNACSENNWDNANGYKLSGACGQLEQKYEDYTCEFACPKIPDAQISAVTHAQWYGAPGPFFCAPDKVLEAAGKMKNGKTGSWSIGGWCDPKKQGPIDKTKQVWERPQCGVYKGQKAGGYNFNGSGGSVEGCCWWGRGVIQTTGRCNFGKLNHFLGMSHIKQGKNGRCRVPPAPSKPLYPDIDFCKNPEIICSTTDYPELKWNAGLFYWMLDVQEYVYEDDNWSYLNNLRHYVKEGLKGDKFIDAVSTIVNRGCHKRSCATATLDGGSDRRANFKKVLKAMGVTPGTGSAAYPAPTSSTPSTPADSNTASTFPCTPDDKDTPDDKGTSGEGGTPDDKGTNGEGGTPDDKGASVGGSTSEKEVTGDGGSTTIWVVVVILGILLLIASLVGLYFWWQRRTPETKKSVPPQPVQEGRTRAPSPRGHRTSRRPKESIKKKKKEDNRE